MFLASDSSETAGTCDHFNVRAKLITNPADAFRLDFYRATCDAPMCISGIDSSWSTRFVGSAYGPGAPSNSIGGECNCSAGSTLLGGIVGSKCADDSSKFFVRVYRKPGAVISCSAYVLEISNGSYAAIGGP